MKGTHSSGRSKFQDSCQTTEIWPFLRIDLGRETEWHSVKEMMLNLEQGAVFSSQTAIN